MLPTLPEGKDFILSFHTGWLTDVGGSSSGFSRHTHTSGINVIKINLKKEGQGTFQNSQGYTVKSCLKRPKGGRKRERRERELRERTTVFVEEQRTQSFRAKRM